MSSDYNLLLSRAERMFIFHSIKDNLRTDGRTNGDYRPMELETDVISTTNGSSRLRLANTEVIVGVKLELVEPDPSRPDVGSVDVFVDCSANATPDFAGRGGEELAAEIGSCLLRTCLLGGALDLHTLCLLRAERCWLVHVDVVILNARNSTFQLLELGGSLYDAVSIAAKAALHNTRIPQVTVDREDHDRLEIDVVDDPQLARRLDVSRLPILVTTHWIGGQSVVDVTLEEETCSLASLVCGVSGDGEGLVEVKKCGSGSLAPSSMQAMLQMAESVGQQLNRTLMQKLDEEEKSLTDVLHKPHLTYLR